MIGNSIHEDFDPEEIEAHFFKHNINDDSWEILFPTSNNISLDTLIIKHRTESPAMNTQEFDYKNTATQ